MQILSKIHRGEYIEDMYEHEYLYFSSLKEFRSSKKDDLGRLDPKELNLKNEQLKTLTVVLDDKEIDIHKMKGFNGQYMEHLIDPNINCCSMHWLEIEPGQPASTLNDRLIEMGDKALLIYNRSKFLEIIDKSIEELGFEYSRRKVTYYNPKIFSGEITLHHKDEEYSWQNEFRILIGPTNNQPIKVPIKGLKQISCIINTIHLRSLRIDI